VLRKIDGPLDDTVPADRPITLDDLLTARMGFGMLVEPTMDPPFPIVTAANALELALSQPDPRTPHPPDEWMRRFGTLPLMAQPGQRWQYNVSSLVLGVLVARAAGQSLGDVLRTRIFSPLEMHETGFWLPAELTRRLPSYYLTNFETGQLELRTVSTPEEWSRPPVFPSGAGGLLSTVDDYLAFGRAAAAVGVGGRADDAQPPQPGADGQWGADPRRARARVGVRRRGGDGARHGMAQPGQVRMVGWVRDDVVQRSPTGHRGHGVDPDERLPVERWGAGVRAAGGRDLTRWQRLVISISQVERDASGSAEGGVGRLGRVQRDGPDITRTVTESVTCSVTRWPSLPSARLDVSIQARFVRRSA
jgi:CubicO group peptidase (beta-lactamase class C family)